MKYVLVGESERDFPPVLTFTTPKGTDVQIGVRVHTREYDHAINHQADMTLWVQARKDGKTAEFSGRHSPYGEAERAMTPESARLHPDATAWIRTGSAVILLNAAQVAALDSEWRRVETQTPEGATCARLREARADAEAHKAAVQQRAHEERGVRVLNSGADGWTLCWGVPLNAEELAARGFYPTARILLRWGGEQTELEHLTWQNPVLAEITEAAPIAGSFQGPGGSDNAAWAITPGQWDALSAENVRVSEAAAAQRAQQQADAQAREAAVFAAARATGERQVLSSWMDDDDTIPDNSFSEFTRWALPDGTTTVTKRPYH